MVKKLNINLFVSTESTNVTDGQTDRQSHNFFILTHINRRRKSVSKLTEEDRCF